MGGGSGLRGGPEVGDRDQRQADVAELGQETVKGGLVDDEASSTVVPSPMGAQGHPVEPGGPPGGEVPPDTDLVTGRFVPAG